MRVAVGVGGELRLLFVEPTRPPLLDDLVGDRVAVAPLAYLDLALFDLLRLRFSGGPFHPVPLQFSLGFKLPVPLAYSPTAPR